MWGLQEGEENAVYEVAMSIKIYEIFRLVLLLLQLQILFVQLKSLHVVNCTPEVICRRQLMKHNYILVFFSFITNM